MATGSGPRSGVAICAVMRLEPPEDVLEWLIYHRNVGISKVFLRVNADSVPPGVAQATKALARTGFLDLAPKPGPKHPTQSLWYSECGLLAATFRWVAFIDLDEFLVVLDECASWESVPGDCVHPAGRLGTWHVCTWPGGT